MDQPAWLPSFALPSAPIVAVAQPPRFDRMLSGDSSSSFMQIASPTMMQRDEAERLKSLAQYEILDTLPDPALDEITRLAASFCRAPYAYISFIDASRVWFKSRIGFLSRHPPRAPSA